MKKFPMRTLALLLTVILLVNSSVYASPARAAESQGNGGYTMLPDEQVNQQESEVETPEIEEQDEISMPAPTDIPEEISKETPEEIPTEAPEETSSEDNMDEDGDNDKGNEEEESKKEESKEQSLSIDEIVFPDDNLRKYVKQELDTDGSGTLDEAELSKVIKLDISHRDIYDLQGLEVFLNLESLDCSWNHLTREETQPYETLKELKRDHNAYLVDKEDDVREERDKDYLTFVAIQSQEDIEETKIEEDVFPDDEFRRFISIHYDKDEDGVLSKEEIRQVTSLYLKEEKIESLWGIGIFKNLLFLNCETNQLDKLDMGELLQLRGLYCKENNITELDATPAIHLKELECDPHVEIVGWKSAEENSNPEEEALGDSQQKIYTVSFDSAGGSVKPSLEVTAGEKVKAPSNPVRHKYLFGGWYLGKVKYDFETPVTADITLTAKWNKVTVAKGKVKKLSNSKKGVLTASWDKISNANSYEVQLADSTAFKTNVKKVTTTKTSASFSKLYKNKTYYVRVRAYTYDSAKVKIYGTYSAVKKLKITNGILQVKPSSTATKITSVKLISTKTVEVKASAPNEVKSSDNYYYVFTLAPAETKLSAGRKPIAKAKKVTSPEFRFSLNRGTSISCLQKKFVVAVKTGVSYTIVSSSRFISNPEKLAKYNYSFPKASTKKGLQVNENYISDAVSLGVKNTTYNMCLDDIIATSSQKNNAQGISYRYDGTTYWFSRGIIQSYDRTLNQYKQNKMVVSAIILLRWRSDLTYLIPTAGRVQGHSFYALNTSTSKARKQLEAVFTFLAERYASNGRIANWIIGNEVNNYGVYQYAGSASLSTNARIYADSFRLAYIALRSVYSKARVYISLDHLWSTLVAGAHGSRQFLESFSKYWNSYGNFNIAYHAYPSPLTEPEFWRNTNGAITNSVNTPCISMGNIRVLTNYVKSKFGSGTRIILSEQGFTSKRYGANVEKNQAAAIAYAYYLSEFNSMIDAFIVHRHIDHQIEVNQGLALGLWTNKAGTYEAKGKKKYAWSVYKYMDTASGAKKTAFALPIIGAKKWSSIVPGYTASRF